MCIRDSSLKRLGFCHWWVRISSPAYGVHPDSETCTDHNELMGWVPLIECSLDVSHSKPKTICLLTGWCFQTSSYGLQMFINIGVLLRATSLNYTSVVTDCETLVSVLQPSALKMAIEGTAKTFAHNNLGPWPYSPVSWSSNNIEASDRIQYYYL